MQLLCHVPGKQPAFEELADPAAFMGYHAIALLRCWHQCTVFGISKAFDSPGLPQILLYELAATLHFQ